MFGGKSTEHHVAVISALHLVQHLEPARYRVSALYINQDGLAADSKAAGAYLDTLTRNIAPARFPNLEHACRMLKTALACTPPACNREAEQTPLLLEWLAPGNFDLVFPVFHGVNGEDGTIQGLLEFLNIPYTGCGVLNSAVCLDKEMTKQICLAHRIPVIAHLTILQWEWEKQEQQVLAGITGSFPYPVFIKPARSGSSIGITRAGTLQQLRTGINLAFGFDDKVLVEPGVPVPREITLGIMGFQDEILLSAPGEFNYTDGAYFDYEAKYAETARAGTVPAELSYAEKHEIKELAFTIFRAFNLAGYARLDFFLVGKKIFFNEINTIPCLESNGTFMRTWQSGGISISAFIDKVVELALKKHQLKADKLYKTDLNLQS